MLKKNKVYFPFFIGMLLQMLWMGCNDNPLELPNETYTPQNVGSVKDTTLFAVSDTTYLVQTHLSTDFSDRLLIGTVDNFQARPIMRFTTLPDSALFQEIKIRFVSAGTLSVNPGQAFTATAYPVLNKWESNTDSVWTDYQQNFDASKPLGDVQISTATSDTLYLILNQNGIDEFNAWSSAISNDANPGIILDFSAADFIKYFTSRNSSENPMLVFTYKNSPNDTTVIADSVIATFDAVVYQGAPTPVANRNYASSFAVYNSLYKFDLENFLSKFPGGVEIISANLQLWVDRGNTLLDPHFGADLRVFKLTSEIENSSVVIDSSTSRIIQFSQWSADSSFLEVNSGGERQRLARQIIQPQLIGLQDNKPYGLAVGFLNNNTHYSYFAFYKRNAGSAARRPRLILKYQIPPETRF